MPTEYQRNLLHLEFCTQDMDESDEDELGYPEDEEEIVPVKGMHSTLFQSLALITCLCFLICRFKQRKGTVWKIEHVSS